MIWLSSSALSRLRDQLRTSGQRPSITLAAGGKLAPEVAELVAASVEYGPFCEAMYLMMSADGRITADEREVLRGALRRLSGETLRSVHIEAMLDAATKSVADKGRDERLRAVSAQLREDTARAEVAFVLAAAVAFADSAIADEENDALIRFAEELGIDEARADALLDGMEADRTDPGAGP